VWLNSSNSFTRIVPQSKGCGGLALSAGGFLKSDCREWRGEKEKEGARGGSVGMLPGICIAMATGPSPRGLVEHMAVEEGDAFTHVPTALGTLWCYLPAPLGCTCVGASVLPWAILGGLDGSWASDAREELCPSLASELQDCISNAPFLWLRLRCDGGQQSLLARIRL
jgi:hypothetical protein